nr:hypothetical protein [Micromonospora sp. DSM 115978]
MIRFAGRRVIAPLVALLLLAVGVAPVPASAAPPGADRHPGGKLVSIRFEGHGQEVHLWDVNRSGLVLGALGTEATGIQPVLWRSYDNPVPIDLPDGHSIQMNNRGHIVGIGNDDLDGVTWLWRPNGMTYLRWPGMLVWTTALNDRDQIAGSLEHPEGDTLDQPFRWQDGEFTLLEVPEGMSGHVYEINNRGDVLGWIVNRDWSIQRTVLWRGTTMIELTPPGGGSARPFDVNDRGQIVGSYTRPGSDLLRPFLWDRGRFVDLLPDRPNSSGFAYDINESGEIVGSADNRAVLWRDGRMIDLGVPGTASVINERGDVAGEYYTVVSGSDLALRVYRWRAGRLLHSDPVIGPEVGGGVSSIDDKGRLYGGISNPGRTDEGPRIWLPAR